MLEDIVASGLAEMGIAPADDALKRFRVYYTMLEEKNRVMNLTAISGEEDTARLHFLDCAALLKCTDMNGKTVFDIGTGAGFPGLPLKILCPEIKLTLIDSLDKRIGFLKEVCSELGFADTVCLHARAEEAAADFRGKADIVTSRAVAGLNVLSELCLPYVKENGKFIAMKGPDFDAELENAKKAIKELGGKTEKCVKYAIPGADIIHSAIIIKKLSPSPACYPRTWAKIKNKPIQ